MRAWLNDRDATRSELGNEFGGKEKRDEKSNDPRKQVDGEDDAKQLAVRCDPSLSASEHKELSGECEDGRKRNEEGGDINRRRCRKDDVC